MSGEGNAAAIDELLLGWIRAPAPGRGLHTLEGDTWSFIAYPALARRALSVAQQLHAAGVKPGEPIGVPDVDTVEFAAGFFGTLLAGATVVAFANPSNKDARSAGQPAEVLGAADVRRVLLPSARAVDVPPGVDTILAHSQGDTPLPRVAPADVAMIQFTSGSSAQPRGVRIRAANLAANVAAIHRWLDLADSDAGASWLPLHHDMGLVGQLVAGVTRQVSLWLMRPLDFLLQPLRWLECFGRYGATIGAAPGFGYAYAARRLRPAQLEGLDFSGWRAAIAGAERLTADALGGFAELLAPFGLRPEAIRPAYGLAEATLAVTGHRGMHAARVVAVPSSGLALGRPVTAHEAGTLGERRGTPEPDWLVSSGRPLEGVHVEVADAGSGAPLPPGSLGEILVRGSGVAMGYLDGETGSTRFDDGAVWTGDAGFQLDGELFVLGRMSDSLKVRGRLVHAEALEHELGEGLGILQARCVVVADWMAPAPRVVAIVEQPPGEWESEALRLLGAALGPTVSVSVRSVPPRTILRTTSGKPRRRSTWELVESFPAAP